MSTTETAVEDLEGRELDAAVAEEVMGEPAYAVEVSEQGSTYAKWEPTWSGDVSEDDTAQVACPTYSTEIDAAWEVWESLRGQYPWVSLWQETDGETMVEIETKTVAQTDPRSSHEIRERADAAPLAICRAALKAVRNEPARNG